MSTEPIGFKGQSGKLTVSHIWNMEYSIVSASGQNVLHAHNTPVYQVEATAQLFCAAKKMAVALQDQLQWMETFYDAIKDKEGYSEMSLAILKNKIERAKKVLTDAGVESNIDSMLKGL